MQLGAPLFQGSLIQPGVISVSGGSFAQPFNRLTAQMGDSRTAGASQITGALGSGSGTISYAMGRYMMAWLEGKTGFRLLRAPVSNYGISGQTVSQVLADPRSVSTIGWRQLLESNVANIILLLGTNDLLESDGAALSGSAQTLLQDRIRLATDPTYAAAQGWTLWGGLAKNLWIITEPPQGLNIDGTPNVTRVLNSTKDANLVAWADFQKKFSYDSGDALANPRVVVIDALRDIRLWNTGLSFHQNQNGLNDDGVHWLAAMADIVATMLGERAAALLDVPVNPLPATGATSAFVTNNPLMTGTGGTSNTSNFTTNGGVIDSTSIPASWTLAMLGWSAGGATGIRAAMTRETDADGYDVFVLRIYGTPTTTQQGAIAFAVNGNGSAVFGTDTLYATGKLGLTRVAGQVTQFFLSGISSVTPNTYRMESQTRDTRPPAPDLTNAYREITTEMLPLLTGGMNTALQAVGATATGQSVSIGISPKFVVGELFDATFRIARCGLRRGAIGALP